MRKHRRKESCPFSLKKRRIITIFIQFWASEKENRGSLFTRNQMEKTRGNGCKLHKVKIHLGIRKEFFIVRTTLHWKGLSRVLEGFKM